jgi:hypothetical protein
MKNPGAFKSIATATAVLGCTALASAQLTFWVDMDTSTAGIQDTIAASPGQTLTADIGVTVGAAGISSYSISVQFDTAALTLNGSPSASVPALPGGLSSLSAPAENNALGHVYSFNGATLGLGPTGTSFVLGSINFKAVTPNSDGLADVSLGFFNVGVDGAFDNAGNPVVPTFNPGFVVVPEPTATMVVMAAVAAFSVAWRRWILEDSV